jgi:hypothetical protein
MNFNLPNFNHFNFMRNANQGLKKGLSTIG